MAEWRKGTYLYLILLFVLCTVTSILAGTVFAKTVRQDGFNFISLTMLIIFVLLYSWIAIGFWTATFGFVRELIVTNRPSQEKTTSGPFPKTAVIMPVYNEEVSGVFSRLQAMIEGITETSNHKSFDFFILSDSTDPDICLEEEQAWALLRSSLMTDCGIYYRRRTNNISHKSGNIRDFCKKWGNNYRYMVVLDADSLMEPETILEMVRKMEADKKIGILQSHPMSINQRSFFGRLQQFSSHLYGPIFTSGYALWSQVAGTYWGHNAIIRIHAFMDSCGLPEFPGHAPLGGEILSHDFVEAALILKKGWKVVIDHNLKGSYEECPANLIDFARRDQRWCQGNLQHIRLVMQHGLRLISRVQLGMGAMGYLSSPLWAAFLILIILMGFAAGSNSYNNVSGGLELFIGTILLLILPKIWALILVLISPEQKEGFAGSKKAASSVVLEIVVSILMAPILMVFHTAFVIMALLGHSVHWESQPRNNNRLVFKDAFREHSMHTIVGLSGLVLVTWLSPEMLPWLMPVLLPLVFSIPLSMLLSRQNIGIWLQKHGFLMIPQEVHPPAILQRQRLLQYSHLNLMRETPHPFVRGVIVPAFNDLHIALIPEKSRSIDAERLNRLRRIALTGGPEHLSKEELKEIISDADTLRWLHRRAWNDWPVEILENCQKIWVSSKSEKCNSSTS